MFAKQWVGAPSATTLTRLASHEFVGVVNLATGRQSPFKFHTPTLDEVFGDLKREDLVGELDEVVRQNTRWQTAEEVEQHQRGLDEAILQELSGARVVRFPGTTAAGQRTRSEPAKKAVSPRRQAPGYPPSREGAEVTNGFCVLGSFRFRWAFAGGSFGARYAASRGPRRYTNRQRHLIGGRFVPFKKLSLPSFRRRRPCRARWCKSSRAVPLTCYALCSSSRACTTSSCKGS